MPKKGTEKKLSFKDFRVVDYKPGEDELIKRNAKKRKKDSGEGTLEAFAPKYVPGVWMDRKQLPPKINKIVNNVFKLIKKHKGRNISVSVELVDKRYKIHVLLGRDYDEQFGNDLMNLSSWKDKTVGMEVAASMSPAPKKTIREEYINEMDNEDNEQMTLAEVLSFIARRKQAVSLRKNKAKVKMGARRQSRKTADPKRLKRRADRGARRAMFKKLAKGKSKGQLSLGKRIAIEKRLDKMKGKIARMSKRSLPSVRKMDKDRRSNRSGKK